MKNLQPHDRFFVKEAISRRQLLMPFIEAATSAAKATKPAASGAKKVVTHLDDMTDFAIKNPGTYAAAERINSGLASQFLHSAKPAGVVGKAVDIATPQPSLSYLAMNNKKIPLSRRTLLKIFGINALRGREAVYNSVVHPDTRRLVSALRVTGGASPTSSALQTGVGAQLVKEVAPPKFVARNRKKLVTLAGGGIGGGGLYELFESTKNGGEQTSKEASVFKLVTSTVPALIRSAASNVTAKGMLGAQRAPVSRYFSLSRAGAGSGIGYGFDTGASLAGYDTDNLGTAVGALGGGISPNVIRSLFALKHSYPNAARAGKFFNRLTPNFVPGRLTQVELSKATKDLPRMEAIKHQIKKIPTTSKSSLGDYFDYYFKPDARASGKIRQKLDQVGWLGAVGGLQQLVTGDNFTKTKQVALKNQQLGADSVAKRLNFSDEHELHASLSAMRELLRRKGVDVDNLEKEIAAIKG